MEEELEIFKELQILKQEWTEQAEELLFEKYQEEFCICSIGKSYGNDGNLTYTVTASPKADSNCLFYADIAKTGAFMQDSYISAIICRKICNEIKEELPLNDEEYYLYFAPGSKWVEGSDKNMTLHEFIATNPKNRFVIYFAIEKHIDKAKQDKVINAIQKCLCGKGNISGILRLSYLNVNEINNIKEYMSVRAWSDSGLIKILESGEEQRYEIDCGTILI